MTQNEQNKQDTDVEKDSAVPRLRFLPWMGNYSPILSYTVDMLDRPPGLIQFWEHLHYTLNMMNIDHNKLIL